MVDGCRMSSDVLNQQRSFHYVENVKTDLVVSTTLQWSVVLVEILAGRVSS